MWTDTKNPSLRLRSEAWNVFFRVRKKWPLWVLASTVFVVAGLYFGKNYRPMYQSLAQVRVGEDLDARSVPGQREDPSEWADLPDALANAFRARVVVDASVRANVAKIAARPELAHVAQLQTDKGLDALVEDIKRTLLVEAVTRRLFQLTYNARDPVLAQIVLQTFAEAGVQDVVAQRIETAKRVRVFLTDETERSKQRLLEAENQVVQFVQKHPKLLVSISATERNKLGLQAADKLLVTAKDKPVLTATKVAENFSSPELRPLLEKRAQFEAQIAQIESAHKFDPAQQKVLEIERLQQQLLDLKSQGYTPQYPEFQRITADMERISKDVRDVRSGNSPKLAEDLLLQAKTRAQMAALDRQIAAMRRKLTGTDKLSADQEALSAEAEYARLFRDLENARVTFDKLRERQQEALVNEQLARVPNNAAARIIDNASFPTKPRGLSKNLMLGLLSVLGLLAGLAITVIRALSDRRIFSAVDLWHAARLPVLANLPKNDRRPRRNVLPEVLLCGQEDANTPKTETGVRPPPKPGKTRLRELGYVVRTIPSLPPSPELFLLSQPDGARAEQIRLLSCRLRERGNPRLLFLVSSQPQEGKSVAAANLALALAEGGGSKVALLDAQVLAPRLHTLFLPGQEIPSTDLRDCKPELWEVSPDLCLLPAPVLANPKNRAAVENSPAFASLLDDLLEAFDYVIVDTPSMSLAADARLLLQHGGEALLVVRAGHTNVDMLSLSLDRIEQHSVCGLLLTS
ncbi:MAG TPA: GNVR domain-containing protein [Pseudomonadota bacterium]|nr:GNVR domain-containing protein [Pseudomonadota bacterium]